MSRHHKEADEPPPRVNPRVENSEGVTMFALLSRSVTLIVCAVQRVVDKGRSPSVIHHRTPELLPRHVFGSPACRFYQPPADALGRRQLGPGIQFLGGQTADLRYYPLLSCLGVSHESNDSGQPLTSKSSESFSRHAHRATHVALDQPSQSRFRGCGTGVAFCCVGCGDTRLRAAAAQ